jgi:hydroxyacylglutathione hydrolase
MGVSIYPIGLGFARGYVIQGEGCIMVDAGSPNQARGFIRALERLPVQLEDIQLMVITHGHWDHIGSAKDIKEITGAKIAMYRREKDWLEKSLKVLPPGVTPWGRIFVGMLAMLMPLVHIPAAHVDIILGDEGLSLTEYGIPGRVVPTPGHTMGSVSVLLETGDALVGDLAMNEFPLRFSPGLPILADDLQRVKGSWKLLLEEGAEVVYPGHGKPFSAEIIRRALYGGGDLP